jgi:TolB protein
LGTFNVGLELSEALGTPIVEEETPVAISNATPTATLEPTPTATRPPEIPAPQVVPRSALVGTIAYPVFNGTDYDIFLGKADGSGTTQFLRDGASQPAFNADGSRIAFHSWRGDSRGLVTMDVSGANGYLIANFIEDQLPTWSADGQDIIFLSRRSEGRQSELYLTNGSTELGDAVVIGEGEYPSMSPNGQLAFKGWGTTAYGLRVGSASLDNLTTVTNGEEDTAPILSPDGSKVAFMSRRADNWDIYVANVDGSELLQLTTDESDDGLPAWAPNGNAIAFVSNRGGTWAIWTVSPLGSGTRQLFSMQGSPDGMVGSDSYASRGWAEERISWTAAELVE